MKSKKSNTTRGRGTKGSRGHGQDKSKKQLEDAQQLKKFSKTKGTKIVRIPDTDASELASFPSEFGALRRDVTDNMGYRVPRLVPGAKGEYVPMPNQLLKKKVEKEGRKNRTIPEAYSVVVPGQPDLDAGVSGWIQPVDTNDFVKLGNRVDALLETFNRVNDEIQYAKDSSGKELEDSKGEWIEVGRIPKVKNWRAESSRLVEQGSGGVERVERVKADASTVSMRDTLGASPAISRALQRMIEDGFVAEARQAIESIMEPLGLAYEGIFRGPKTNAKVSSALPHVGSGHFHIDLWPHSTYLSEAKTGVNGDTVPVRFWDSKATCHFGPGPGVTFWMRHFDVLGDLVGLAKTEPVAAERAGYTKMLCDQAIAGCRKRSQEAHEKALAEKAKVEAAGETFTDWIRPADDFARDIKISRVIDRLLSEAIGALGLEKDYVSLGRAEYRTHLIEAYKAGDTGIRMRTAEDLEQVAKVAERAEKRARVEREAAEKALLAVSAEKEAVERLLAEAASLRSGLDSDMAAFRTAEAALPAKEAAAELRGLQRAVAKIFPGRPSKPETVEQAKRDWDSGVAGIHQEAELGAWSKISKFWGKGEVRPGATVETMAKRVEEAITGRIADGLTAGLAGFFRLFNSEVPPKALTPAAIETAAVGMGEEYQAGARRDGLALAVAKIRGVEVSALDGLDEAGLSTEIESEAGKFREGQIAPEKAAVHGLAKYIFGQAVTKFLTGDGKKTVVELKNMLSAEFKRRGNAEVQLERALPVLEQHAPEIALAARKTLDARPKLPDVPAKKVAKKVEKNKPPGGGLPGGLG
jgi:hypothetical protein